MLYRALGSIERGVYIDIGAQHPTIDSVSRAFFERGWFGVHVEPVPEYAAMLREARPGDVVIQAAVSSQAGEISLAVFPDTGLSTVVESVAEGHASQTQFAAARREVVPAVTLSMVGDEVGNRDVHWLKIDVEGHERAVLEGWDASRLRPWICVIEATLPNSAETNHSEWDSILLKAGYECAYVDGLNRFYVAEERSARLRQAFDTPPNVFDNCQLGEHASMCRELVTRHHRRLSGLSRQLDLAQQNHRELEAAYKAVKASMSWKLTEPLRVAIDWLNKLAALISYRNGRPAHPPATQGSRDRADRSVSLPTISPATKTWQSRLRQQSQAKT
jgi:FkbM family methyltransferase